ncbi:MAG: anhydro-N-acetylmuramic acid kinase [Paracoccaceae bacterium]
MSWASRQTLAHDPKGQGTHQAGDGQKLAEALGKRVVWDFRSSDVALGGEGAPPRRSSTSRSPAISGRASPSPFSTSAASAISPGSTQQGQAEGPGALFAFDTGPANALIDDFMRATRDKPYDEGGACAAKGEADPDVIDAFLAEGYFHRMPPKSLDRGAFAGLAKAVKRLTPADAAATLTLASAAAVIRGFEHLPEPPARLLVTGGGRRNATMMAMLGKMLEGKAEPVEAVGLDGDMLEAQAFGYLAVRVLRGLPTSCPGTTGVAAAVGGGIVSEPG